MNNLPRHHGISTVFFQPLDVTALEANLGTERIGRRILVYQTTSSTNDAAWHYLHEPHSDGLAVFAEQQSAGRGRLGRTWIAPAQTSLLMSVLLQHEDTVPAQALTLLAGLAPALAIEAELGIETEIKWPNDVMISDRKVAGSMVEAKPNGKSRAYVIGIGINCSQRVEDFPPELRAYAVSLAKSAASTIDRNKLARRLLIVLDEWLKVLERRDYEPLHEAWLARCSTMHQRLTLIYHGKEFTGTVADVSPHQGILLRLDTGGVQFFDAATATVKKNPSPPPHL